MSIRIGPFTNLFQMIERKYMSDNLLYQLLTIVLNMIYFS